MNRADLLERFARITEEVAEARYIHSRLAYTSQSDPNLAYEQRMAQGLLRRRGWTLPAVSALVEQIDQGIRVVPLSPKRAESKGARKSGGFAGMLDGGSGGGSAWERDVQSWQFLQASNAPPQPATPEQVSWWCEEAQRRMRGLPARPRPRAPNHPDGYGQGPAAAQKPRPPARGSIMDGVHPFGRAHTHEADPA